MRRSTLFAMLFAVAACANPLATPPDGRDAVVFFPTGSFALTPEGQQVVTRAADTIRETRPTKVVVEGHADGGTPFDATLANERARTVINALAMAGVEAKSVELAQSAPPAGTTGLPAHKALIRMVP